MTLEIVKNRYSEFFSMAIAPIDLSTIYSQLNNVAKNVAHQQQGAQLTQAMQENALIRQNQELSAQVHKTADSEAKAAVVKDDSNGNGSQKFQHKNKKQPAKNEENVKMTEIRESFLGQNIDISR